MKLTANSQKPKAKYMNIEGLDYNTQREKLLLPEYGREVQKMVEHAKTLPTKEERQRCAETIIGIMDKMYPQSHENADYKQKLWDHLALMSNFELDIDYPYDVQQALQMRVKPEPLNYSTGNIPVRHYGKLTFELFDTLKNMPEGPERDELARYTANQMKRSLLQWSHGTADDQKVIDDLAHYTDGVISLDSNTFKFAKVSERDFVEKRRKKK